MAEERAPQSMGKSLILALLVIGGTLMFLMFMGKAVETAASPTHHMTWPWP